MEPGLLVVVRAPALVRVEPLTFKIILLSEVIVTLVFILVAAEVVVVTDPVPAVLRFSVVAPPPESENVRVRPGVGAIVILPAVEDSVAEEALGKIMLRLLAPPPELTLMEVAETVEPDLKSMVGLASTMALPPETVVVVPTAATTDPPAAGAVKLTRPAAPALNVKELPRVRALAPPA
jgi:hypothetical protein